MKFCIQACTVNLRVWSIYIYFSSFFSDVSAPTVDVRSLTLTRGDTKNITCVAFGVPDVSFVWKKGNVTVTRVAQLHLKDVRVNDGGEYDCYAYNIAGVKKASTNVQLTCKM